MKYLKTQKFFKALFAIACLTLSLIVGLLISLNFIVDPIIYWLASTEGARIFIACIISWLSISRIFDLYYRYYKRRMKKQRFNALTVPYPRTFRGRKLSK